MSDVHRRFVALIERLRIEDGGGRGWRTRVAKRLGIHGPDLTKVISGKREVGYEMALRAVDRIGIPAAEFFGWTSTAEPARTARQVAYREALDSLSPSERATLLAGDLAGDPEYAAIGACLALTLDQWQRVRAYVDARKGGGAEGRRFAPVTPPPARSPCRA